MLNLVKVKSKKIDDYQSLISKKLFFQIKRLSQGLNGLKVFHINSTPKGGGVAEVLKSLVPLMKGVGLDARWYSIPYDKKFFQLTKRLHNTLQGKEFSFSGSAQEEYQKHLKRIAGSLKDIESAIWVIHDPQPVGLVDYLDLSTSLISRIHIDTTNSNPEAWQFISHFLRKYDKIIFSSRGFVRSKIPGSKTVIFPPAIDPLTVKNKALSLKEAKNVLKGFGFNFNKPLISQVSRFDRWKDPLGVIEAFRLARQEIPGLQLVLVGFFQAQDDPEAEEVYRAVKNEIEREKDIYLFADLKELKGLNIDIFVNAVQVISDVVLQKSIREGFGLTVAEAMWKGKLVIGGNVGGIKLQIDNGRNGFLVSSPEQAADRIVKLIGSPALAKKIGERGRNDVRNNFLTPRLLKDYLKLF